MVFCAAPPPREPIPQRRKPAVEFENFARPSLRDIPDHRASRSSKRPNGFGCCGGRPGGAASPVHSPAPAGAVDEWAVWDQLMHAVDDVRSPSPSPEKGAGGNMNGTRPESPAPKRSRLSVSFPRLPLFSAKPVAVAVPAEAEEEPEVEPPQALSPRDEAASPTPRDWADQVLRVRAVQLTEEPADSVVQAVARESASPIDGTSVLTATVVSAQTPPPTVIHVGDQTTTTFVETRTGATRHRRKASESRKELVHQLAELGHTAALAGDYEGAAATFGRALAADPDDRVGRSDEILAARDDAHRMARAQEEYDLEEAVERSRREYEEAVGESAVPEDPLAEDRVASAPREAERDRHRSPCCSPESVDSAERWEWGSLGSASTDERSVDDISDEDVVVPEMGLSPSPSNDSWSEEAEYADQCLPDDDPVPAARPEPARVEPLAEVAASPSDGFPRLKMNFSFLTTHEVLDLNEWRNLHDEEKWQGFAGGVRERRGGAYPDEWLDVVQARKQRLDALAGGESPSNAAGEEPEGPSEPRLRPGCVPWESHSLGVAEGGADSDGAPMAPRAVQRFADNAFSVPAEESLDGPVAPACEAGQARMQRLEALTGDPVDDAQQGEAEEEEEGEELEGGTAGTGAFIWHPQPLTIARKVSSA